MRDDIILPHTWLYRENAMANRQIWFLGRYNGNAHGQNELNDIYFLLKSYLC